MPKLALNFSKRYKATTKVHDYEKELLFVMVLDEDSPMHVPMSLRERSSALDLWLAVEKRPASVLDRMTG